MSWRRSEDFPPPLVGGGEGAGSRAGRRERVAETAGLGAKVADIGSTMLDARVKFLRQNQTRPEYRLWLQLRGKRICGRRFRRQFRLDRYIVDFVCLSVRLVVEVDGPSHDLTADQDAIRTRRLEAQGFRVIRFSNEDVMHDLDSVVRTIEAAIVARMAEGIDVE